MALYFNKRVSSNGKTAGFHPANKRSIRLTRSNISLPGAMKIEVLHEYNKTAPDWAERELARFGTNVYGEPLYRIVWGESRLELAGGLWEDRDGAPEARRLTNEKGDSRDVNLIRETAEYRWIPKYSVSRWVLEKWLPPEHYGDVTVWEANRDDKSGLLPLGPFPQRGEYEHCFTFEAAGQYIPITHETVAGIARLIEAGRAYSRAEKKVAIVEKHSKKRKAWEDRVDDIVHDSSDAFNGNARSGPLIQGDKKRTADDVKLDIRADQLPQQLRNKKGFNQI